METSAPGWYADPTGRYEYRYWTGVGWSRHVDGSEGRTVDPLEAPAGIPSTNSPFAVREAPAPAATSRRQRRHTPIAVAASAVVVVAIILGLAAAGVTLILTVDGSEADRDTVAEPIDPVVMSLVEYIVDISEGTVGEEDAACMAQDIVDTIGQARLVEAGIDRGADPLTSLTAEEVQTSVPSALECLDDATVEALIARTFSPSMVARLGAQSSDCLVGGWMDGLGRDQLVELYALWASGSADLLTSSVDPTEMDALVAVITACSQPAPAPVDSATP